jgi:uncharacterized protein YbcI
LVDPTSPQKLEDQLGDALLGVHLASYGRTATSARVLISDDAIVVFLDGLELQPSEEFLIEAGEGHAVVDTRGRFEQAIAPTIRAAVERVVGRRVVSFASITKLDPNYGIEIFRLAPSSPPS